MHDFWTWLLFIVIFFSGLYLLSVLEKWIYQDRLDWLGPLRKITFYLQQEDVKPGQRDKIFYENAPFLFMAAVLMGLSVLPFTENRVIVDMATGGLFINAALAYIMVAMLMAGWSANGVYALVGGWRFLAQLVAYSMPVVMTITATVMRAESISMFKIVESQEPLWNIIYQPVGFILFYLAAMALAFLPPFDLPVAKGELASGIWSEFTGSRMMVFRTARLMLILTLSMAVTTFFLGGWYGPFLPGFVWVLLKTMLVAASFFWVGKKMSRLHHDRMLAWSWKFATPAALINIFYVGVILLL